VTYLEEEHGCGDLHGIGHYKGISRLFLTYLRMFDQGSSQVPNVPDNLSMNGARDTVLQLEVHLGNGVFWEYGCIRDITCARNISA